MSNSVNVNFRVTGGEVQSYMDRLQQRSTDLSRTMLRNASAESDVAKEQLRSYQQQLVALERKLRTESELSRITARINRENNLSTMRADIGNRYNQLDTNLQSGSITRRQHRVGVGALDAEEQSRTAEIEEQHRQEINSGRELHRDNAMLLRTMRENVDTVRSTSQQELTQMRRGDESLVDAVQNDDDPTALLANRLSSQQFIEEQANAQEKKKGNFEEGTFGGLLKALTVDKVGGMIAGIPQSKNELDYVKPMAAMMGMAVGGLAGNLLDMVEGSKILGNGLGQTSYGALGAALGEKAGEFAGSALERSFKGRDELTSANYRVQALTGNNMGIDAIGGANGLGGTGIASVTADLKDYGADFKQTAELQYKLATAQAHGRNLSGGVENMLALQQGLGVSQDTFLQLTELLRSSKEGNKDVIKLVGGVASAGKGNVFSQDRTFLGEFMQKNFTNLQKTLLNTQNTVASGTTFDILKRFDSVGGPFAARDSRSGGYINQIHGSLVNPGSDNLKALAMMALRENNPNMDFHDLQKEQQKGLSSQGYLKSMFAYIDKIGGDEGMRKQNFAGLIGMQDNLAASDLLYSKRDDLMSGKISMSELRGSGEYSQDSIRATGKDQTSKYTTSTAAIENAFLESAIKGIETVGEKMKDLFGDMVDGTQEYVNARFMAMITGTNKKEPVRKNQTYTPKTDMYKYKAHE